MSSLLVAVDKLCGGADEVTVKPRGNSMTPRIKSGQEVLIEAVDPASVRVGDVVLCRVRGVIRLHLVTGIDPLNRRVCISNNHGHVNGWTGWDRVYGKAGV